MGTRYNITLHASHAEDAPEDGPPDFLAKVNAWLVERGGLELAEFWEGSHRNTTCYVCTGCSRGLAAPPGFGEMFCGLPWNDPASAIAIVQPEFGPAVIFRPATQPRSAHDP